MPGTPISKIIEAIEAIKQLQDDLEALGSVVDALDRRLEILERNAARPASDQRERS
ncbi:MAG: hypothetical protein JO326_09370 [Acetobacteraceae bacterium]|nr:hypothetical protein [Acetobacteraceae bacterium]